MCFDIWVPSKRVAIEIDGERWHNTEKAKTRDATKAELCIKHDIHLFRFRIPYPAKGRLQMNNFAQVFAEWLRHLDLESAF